MNKNTTNSIPTLRSDTQWTFDRTSNKQTTKDKTINVFLDKTHNKPLEETGAKQQISLSTRHKIKTGKRLEHNKHCPLGKDKQYVLAPV